MSLLTPSRNFRLVGVEAAPEITGSHSYAMFRALKPHKRTNAYVVGFARHGGALALDSSLQTVKK